VLLDVDHAALSHGRSDGLPDQVQPSRECLPETRQLWRSTGISTSLARSAARLALPGGKERARPPAQDRV
jgi:hypothetical protein